MALDEPLIVVDGDEGVHRLAEVVDVVVEPCPQALLLESLDPRSAQPLHSGSPTSEASSAMPSQRRERQSPVVALLIA